MRYDIIRDPITSYSPRTETDESLREVLDSNLPRSVAWWRYYHQFVFNHLNRGWYVKVIPHV